MDGGFILSFCLLLAVLDSAAAQDLNISAVVGDDVTLPCKADRNQPLEVVEWRRSDGNPESVLVFNNHGPDVDVPLPSYQGRVELKDRETGDVSLVLRNVTDEDGGTYECFVLRERSRRKRAKPQPISTVHLHVAPPPGNEDGDTEDGDTEDGDTEDGDTEDGDTEDGDTEDGETEDGEDRGGGKEDESIKLGTFIGRLIAACLGCAVVCFIVSSIAFAIIRRKRKLSSHDGAAAAHGMTLLF